MKKFIYNIIFWIDEFFMTESSIFIIGGIFIVASTIFAITSQLKINALFN